jgi:hypothetical protein
MLTKIIFQISTFIINSALQNLQQLNKSDYYLKVKTEYSWLSLVIKSSRMRWAGHVERDGRDEKCMQTFGRRIWSEEKTQESYA